MLSLQNMSYYICDIKKQIRKSEVYVYQDPMKYPLLFMSLLQLKIERKSSNFPNENNSMLISDLLILSIIPDSGFKMLRSGMILLMFPIEVPYHQR